MANQQIRTNYFLATWSGSRRAGHILGGNLTYIHLQYLEKLDHQLSQITVGWPHNPKESQSYKDWMESLHGTTIGGAKVVVEKMKNDGMSYGQYSRMFARHSDFDRYILTEDDYVPVRHNFDSELIQMFDEYHIEHYCGFLCGMVKQLNFRLPNVHGRPIHAAIAWGATSKLVLDKLVERYGRVPYNGSEIEKDKNKKRHPQVAFSYGFTEAGYNLQDVLGSYCSPYLKGVGTIEYYGNKDNPVIIAPIQYAIRNNLFNVVPESPFKR